MSICWAVDANSAVSSMSILPLIFLPQSSRSELDQRRHRPTGSGEIPQELLTAGLLFAERNRGHKVLHPYYIETYGALGRPTSGALTHAQSTK